MKILLAVMLGSVAFSIVTAEGKNPCALEVEKVGNGTNAFVPSCTANGWYTPEQCDMTARTCICVSPIHGTEINGSRTYPVSDKKLFECPKCLRSQAEALPQPGVQDSLVPQCDGKGWFKPQQSYYVPGQGTVTWCVHVYTGEELNGTRVGSGSPRKTPCSSEIPGTEPSENPCTAEINKLKKNPALDIYFPNCTANGWYTPEQCDAFAMRTCYCVSPVDGKQINGTLQSNVRDFGGFQCPLCLKKQASLLPSVEGPTLDNWIPNCDQKGNFRREQIYNLFSPGSSWCVDPITGEEINGTRVMGRPQRAKPCGSTNPNRKLQSDTVQKPRQNPCVEENERRTKIPGTDVYFYKCTDNGWYTSEQCDLFGNSCYCVNPATGKEINGTRVTAANAPTFKCPNCLKKQAELLPPPEVLDSFLPRCDEKGNFTPEQFYQVVGPGQSWCVDPISGKEINGTRLTAFLPNGRPKSKACGQSN